MKRVFKEWSGLTNKIFKLYGLYSGKNIDSQIWADWCSIYQIPNCSIRLFKYRRWSLNQSWRNPGILDPIIPDKNHFCRQFPLICANGLLILGTCLQIWLPSWIVSSSILGFLQDCPEPIWMSLLIFCVIIDNLLMWFCQVL